MIGIIFASLSAFFAEISVSIGKYEIERHKETSYTFFFLNCLASFVVFAIIYSISPQEFRFVFASIPVFAIQFISALFQSYFSIKSMVYGERSTTSFLLLSIIPIVFAIDMAVGYSLSMAQMQGVLLILLCLGFICIDRDFNKSGIWYTLASVFSGAICVSAYKYAITNYNSVVGNEFLMYGLLAISAFFIAHFFAKENPFSFLRKRTFLVQSGARGISNAMESFAYGFAPASVIVAAKRTAAMLWAIGSGKTFFHEAHVVLRIAVCLALAGGVVLLTM